MVSKAKFDENRRAVGIMPNSMRDKQWQGVHRGGEGTTPVAATPCPEKDR